MASIVMANRVMAYMTLADILMPTQSYDHQVCNVAVQCGQSIHMSAHTRFIHLFTHNPIHMSHACTCFYTDVYARACTHVCTCIGTRVHAHVPVDSVVEIGHEERSMECLMECSMEFMVRADSSR